MYRLKDKVVIITGATSGIAIACARAMASEGAHVALAGTDDYRGTANARAVGGRCIFVPLDVREENAWISALEEVRTAFGGLDVLVNNAAITGTENGLGSLDPETSSLEAWQAIHRTNLDGVFLGCKHAIGLMKHSRQASIINISSCSALVGRPFRAGYASSKAAICNLTKTVALYCAEKRYPIRCNAVLPSRILTSMWDPVISENSGVSHEQLAGEIPMQRFGTPEEVAPAVVFLASDEASFITGSEILVDGGLSAGRAGIAMEATASR